MKKLFLLFILLTLLFVEGVEASEKVSLSISPLIREIEVEPGSSWTGYVKVFNSNPKELYFEVSAIDFVGRGEGYAHYLQRNHLEGDYALSDWITFQDEVISIPPYQNYKFLFDVDIPEEAAPGGIYAGIIASAKEDQGGSLGMTVSPSVSSLLFVKIGGDYYEKIDILEFSTEKVFYDTIEIPFKVRIMNMGNVHVRPEGTVTVLDGDEKIFQRRINPQRGYGNILPQTQRTWSFLWEDDASLFDTGKYQARVDVTYGRKKVKTVSETIEFWIIPSTRQLIALAVALFIILLAVVRLASVYLRYYLSKKKKNKEVLD